MPMTDAEMYADRPSGTDDRSALQGFLEVVNASGRIGTIPPGAYRIARPLVLPLKGRICGANRDRTVIHAIGDVDILRVQPNTDWLDVGHLGLAADSTPLESRYKNSQQPRR